MIILEAHFNDCCVFSKYRLQEQLTMFPKKSCQSAHCELFFFFEKQRIVSLWPRASQALAL